MFLLVCIIAFIFRLLFHYHYHHHHFPFFFSGARLQNSELGSMRSVREELAELKDSVASMHTQLRETHQANVVLRAQLDKQLQLNEQMGQVGTEE